MTECFVAGAPRNDGGVTDFEHYRVDPREPLQPDFLVPDDVKAPGGVTVG
jgi:citronellol/citronellal dehydrogenase